jgi:hypothetical protein
MDKLLDLLEVLGLGLTLRRGSGDIDEDRTRGESKGGR